MTQLRLTDVHKYFGETAILRGVNLSIQAGEKHAIIGPNGAGKTTLFNLISGRQPLSSGSIHYRQQHIHNRPPWEINRLGIARSFQVNNLFPQLSVFENIRCAKLWHSGYGYSFWHLLSRQTRLNAASQALLEDIGLAAHADTPAGELGYAQQRALELGIAIAGNAELILLDEPVAGMSRSEASQAIELIRRVTRGKTLVVIEHDMSVVFNLAERISVLVQGEIIASDTPAAIRANARVQQAYLGQEAGHA